MLNRRAAAHLTFGHSRGRLLGRQSRRRRRGFGRRNPRRPLFEKLADVFDRVESLPSIEVLSDRFADHVLLAVEIHPAGGSGGSRTYSLQQVCRNFFEKSGGKRDLRLSSSEAAAIKGAAKVELFACARHGDIA